MKIKILSAATAIVLALGTGAMAQMSRTAPPTVGGAPMYPSRNIVQNASQAKNLTTLVKAVQAAGLVQTLEGPGPFTVFAPTNEAFAALPPGTVQTLLEPQNKAELVKILTYHVVSGAYTSQVLERDLRATPGGKVSLKTVEGEPLIVSEEGGALMITDQKGGTARVTIPDVFQSNGVVMVIDKVLMP
ncbi:MAG TPA: fasciclin domain-containing protein [Stellaceae bacterium]|nr:fasciclin domain-containing protein [Stellaceae bacterium]